LLTLHDKFGVKENGAIDIELSRQDFASFVGTTYETVFRMLNELIENRLIEVAGKSITIIDKENLYKLTTEIES